MKPGMRMERVARGFVAQKRPAISGGENQMKVNGGKGFWHVGMMPNQKRFASVNRREPARRDLNAPTEGVTKFKVRFCRKRGLLKIF